MLKQFKWHILRFLSVTNYTAILFSVFLLGFIATLFALGLNSIDRTILQIIYSITGTLVGPITGIFVLGMLFPWANTKVRSVQLIVCAI